MGNFVLTTNTFIGLTKEKSSLEVEYEKLLTVNETLATNLELTIRQRKRIEEEQVCLDVIISIVHPTRTE